MMDLDYTQRGTRGPPRSSQSNQWVSVCRQYIFWRRMVSVGVYRHNSLCCQIRLAILIVFVNQITPYKDIAIIIREWEEQNELQIIF